MKTAFRWLPLLVLTLTLTGCDLVGDIIEFGFWMGVIFLLAVGGLVWWGVSKFRS